MCCHLLEKKAKITTITAKCLSEEKIATHPKKRIRESLPYLISAGDARSVEHRQKELWCEDDDTSIRNHEDQEGGSKAIDLGRGSQDSDSWHKAGCQGQRHRAKAHLPSSNQELRGSHLFSLFNSKEHPYSRGNDKEGCKDDIIPNYKVLHLHAGKYGTRELLSTRSQGKSCFSRQSWVQQMLCWERRLWFCEENDDQRLLCGSSDTKLYSEKISIVDYREEPNNGIGTNK